MLGDLINWLEKQDPSLTVKYGFGEPHSYRGYYEDVAFTPKKDVTFGEMLDHARSALGRTFWGYKGGEYTMFKYTDCWIAEYGVASDDKIGPLLMVYWQITAK